MLKSFKTSIAAVALATGMIASAAPAQALFWFEGVAGTGLIGSLIGHPSFGGPFLGPPDADIFIIDNNPGVPVANVGAIDLASGVTGTILTSFTLNGYDIQTVFGVSNSPTNAADGFAQLTTTITAKENIANPTGLTLRIFDEGFIIPTGDVSFTDDFNVISESSARVEFRTSMYLPSGTPGSALGGGTTIHAGTGQLQTDDEFLTGALNIGGVPFALMQEYEIRPDATDDPNTIDSRTLTFSISTIVRTPEPASAAIFGLGLVGLGALRRRKNKLAA